MAKTEFEKMIAECSALHTLLITTDQKGQLMPSFLLTPASDYAVNAGLVEEFESGVAAMRWMRLTEKGWQAKQIAVESEVAA